MLFQFTILRNSVNDNVKTNFAQKKADFENYGNMKVCEFCNFYKTLCHKQIKFCNISCSQNVLCDLFFVKLHVKLTLIIHSLSRFSNVYASNKGQYLIFCFKKIK